MKNRAFDRLNELHRATVNIALDAVANEFRDSGIRPLMDDRAERLIDAITAYMVASALAVGGGVARSFAYLDEPSKDESGGF